ncbi:MAG TPA: cupin domain-containing protein [Anaeromyxobacter sp.]
MTSGPLPRVILDFDAVPWESPGPGVRYKSIVQERQRLRLLEFSAGFEEESWCTGGHAFHVLDGSFSLRFDGGVVHLKAGDVGFLPAGEGHRHKAALGREEYVRLLLFELV